MTTTNINVNDGNNVKTYTTTTTIRTRTATINTNINTNIKCTIIITINQKTLDRARNKEPGEPVQMMYVSHDTLRYSNLKSVISFCDSLNCVTGAVPTQNIYKPDIPLWFLPESSFHIIFFFSLFLQANPNFFTRHFTRPGSPT